MSVIYDSSKAAPKDTALFPVQLAEAVVFILLFAAFYLYYRTHEFSAKHVCIYIMALSAVKGALYYLRDESIGNPLGSHQIICIALFIISLGAFIYLERVKNREQLQAGI
jgi:prolipoprotein diacylglyceryltransferase